MKILYIVNDLDFFNSHRLPIAEKIIENGDQVFMASNKTGKILDIKYYKIDINRSNLNPLQNTVVLLQLIKIINKVKPDIVHSITLKPVIFISILSFFFKKIKIINAISGLGFLFISNRKSLAKTIVELILKHTIKKENMFYNV